MLDQGIELRVKLTTAQTFPATKLVAVKGMPASGQAGGTVEATTSSDTAKVYVPDRPDTGDMDYTYNYSDDNFTAVKVVCDNVARDILIKLPDGTGILYTGVCQTWINETGVGSIIEATLHTVPSVAPTYKTAVEVTALIGS